MQNRNLDKWKLGKMETWKDGNRENGNLQKWKYG